MQLNQYCLNYSLHSISEVFEDKPVQAGRMQVEVGHLELSGYTDLQEIRQL